MKIFITGVSSGIGRETAKQFVQQGHEVWGIARRVDLLKSLSAEINNSKFCFSVCDVSETTAIEKLKNELSEKKFIPDAVIFNAAIQNDTEHDKTQYEQIRSVININMLCSLKLLMFLKEKMLERGSGQFIFVSSLFALLPDKEDFAYAASKSGMSMAFRSLRLQYKGKGIAFKTVYFGPIDTAINPRVKNLKREKTILVSTPQAAGLFLTKVFHSKGHKFYFPFFIRWMNLFFAFTGDSFYDKVTSRFKRA